MKKYLFTVLCAVPGTIMAQQVLTNAIIKAKFETATDNPGMGDGSGPVIQMAGNDTEIKAFLRDSLRKVEVKSNFMNMITLYDGKTGVSTILTESMGEKTAYTQTEAQKAEQRRRQDSIVKARENADGGEGGPGRMVLRMGGTEKVTDIAYTEETKVINTINCKKAVVSTQGNDGEVKKIDVWYSPDYKLPVGVSLSRSGLNLSGLNGLPVLFERSNAINMGGAEITMTTRFEITSIEIGKTIDDKEFAIPKGYKVKTWEEYLKDNPDGGPGMRRTIRVGGGMGG